MTQLSVILTDLIFIFLHFFLFLFTYNILNKKILHPAALFSLVWFFIILLHFILKFSLLDQLEPLSLEVYLIFFIGTFFFCASSVLLTLSLKKMNRLVYKEPGHFFDVNLKLRIFATAVILIGVPFYIQAAFKIFLNSQIEDFFIGLRYELTYSDADIGPLKYLMPLSYVILAVNLYAYYNNKSKINTALLITTFLLTITYAVFATGRTFFFMILIIYLGISFLSNSKFSVRKYMLSLTAFLVLFILFGIILGKGGNSNSTAKDNFRASSEYLGIYLVTSLNALDKQLDEHTEATSNGDYSIRFFLKVAMELNLIPQRKLNEPAHVYAFVPYPTNVYTFYSPYVSDFGRLFGWIMLAIFGALHTWLYIAAVYLKSKRAMLYYTFLLFPLLLSFFADLYLSLFSFWIQLAFFTELLLLINKLINSKFSFRQNSHIKQLPVHPNY